ncbi:Uncharacterised protein [Mycobacterium tuberculosis]|nr:Uncharacterised protein [Mycobacterium tuberculosis]
MLEINSARSARSNVGKWWHGQSAEEYGSPSRSKTRDLSLKQLYNASAAVAQLGFSKLTA